MSTSNKMAQDTVLCRATIFPNKKASSKEEVDFTLGDLTDPPVRSAKEFLPLVKFAVFGDARTEKNCLRHDKNVLEITGAEADYDAEQYPMEEAIERLNNAGISALVYPSPSHTPQAPRWRVLLPFAEPFAGTLDEMKEYRKCAVMAIEDVLGEGLRFASESYRLSQSFYYGHVEGKDYQCIQTEGQCIDEIYDLTPDQAEPDKPPSVPEAPFDINATMQAVIAGDDYHQACNSVFGHLASTGVQQETALGLVQALMMNAADDSDRWRTRYQDLPRCCRDIYTKEATKEEQTNAPHGYTFHGQGINAAATFGDEEPQQVPFIIEGILPQTSFGIAGAGGSLKTTTMLRIMIHVVLGKDIFGKKILKPGPCVLVTSEDEIDTMRYRIRRIVEAMKLTKKEKGRLGNDLIIEDVNGHVARLVEQDSKSNLCYSPTADALLDAYGGREIAILALDPAVYFGPGENYVNDGPAMLMNYARRVSAELGCATGFLHHVGQEAHREGFTDMYAGRGGSAFADNARMVGVMAPPHEKTRRKYPTPALIRELLVTQPDAQVIQLHIAKLSYALCPPQPVWILRDKADPWLFHDVWGTEVDKSAEAKDHEEQETFKRLGCMQQIWEHIDAERKEGRYPNRTAIRALKAFTYGETGASQAKITGAIAAMLQYGFLVEEDLPDELKKGNAKYYLTNGVKPFIGIGGLQDTKKDDEKEES